MDSHVVETTVPAATVEATLREANALAASMATARRVRLGLFLALVVFVGIFVWLFYSYGKTLAEPPYLNKLGDSVQRHLNSKGDVYVRHGKEMVEKMTPHLREVFTKQMEKDMPHFREALDKERPSFMTNMQQQFKKKLDDQYETWRPRYEKILQQEFPKSKDKDLNDRMMNNLGFAFEKLREKYFLKDFERELLITFSIFDQFPAAKAPGKGDDSVEDQFLGALMDLLKYKLTHPPQGL